VTTHLRVIVEADAASEVRLEAQGGRRLAVNVEGDDRKVGGCAAGDPPVRQPAGRRVARAARGGETYTSGAMILAALAALTRHGSRCWRACAKRCSSPAP